MVVTGTPWTSQVIRSPIPTLRSSARSASRERPSGGSSPLSSRGRPLPPPAAGHQLLRVGEFGARGIAVEAPHRPAGRSPVGAVAQDLRGRAAVQAGDARRHHGGQGDRAATRLRHQLGHAVPLVGLDVEEEQIGLVLAGVRRERAVQAGLDHEHGGDEEGAQAECEHDGRGLVLGPEEVRDPLADGVRRARRKVAPGEAGQRHRGSVEQQQSGAQPAGEGEAVFGLGGLPEAEQQHPPDQSAERKHAIQP